MDDLLAQLRRERGWRRGRGRIMAVAAAAATVVATVALLWPRDPPAGCDGGERVGGVDHNVVWAAIAGGLATVLRAEAATRTYLWHRLKKAASDRMTDAARQREEWERHKEELKDAREVLANRVP